MWRCGGSSLSRCGDVVDPHFKCGGPHIIRIYPRMNVTSIILTHNIYAFIHI